ncbi:MAG: proline--tRNA ligase [Candidatus Omnitrophica bacterium]|nr:proline--tRNA ligase [Candidatus Omnitrophota bacterium]
MRWSKILLPTLKEVPADAEAISHILMIRAGLIRKLTAGVYCYLPFGLRVLAKIEKIIREEMNSEGAQELLLPAIQPCELWQKSGRFEALGEDMITFTDRHKKLNVLGPTHEEVITALVKNEVNSYRQMPLILYQIQTKFRDEARPRYGVMRSREFIMKDAYSFDRDQPGLDVSYDKMYDAYCRIFKRCGLEFIPVEADTGIMGGDTSHEFMVLAGSGEDKIACCKKCEYAASLDKAECPEPDHGQRTIDHSKKPEYLKDVSTPGVSSVEDVAAFLKASSDKLLKTIIYVNADKPVAVLVRGGHEVNEAKLIRVLKSNNLEMASAEVIKKTTNAPVGFSGPVGLTGIEIIADYSLKGSRGLIAGANKADTHIIDIDMKRDVQVTRWADIRSIKENDLCPRCNLAGINIQQAIEVGHVFKLGTKYTQSLGATYLDVQGKANQIIMGCYGIGVTRIIAAYLEQNHDDCGIIWPWAISPFQVIIMPLNTDNKEIMQKAENIYKLFIDENIEVLFDDRDIRAGMKFKDADLIGIPIQIIIGEKNLAQGIIEIKLRKTGQREKIKSGEVVPKVLKLIDDLQAYPEPEGI